MENLPSAEAVQYENEYSALLNLMREENLAKMDADLNKE